VTDEDLAGRLFARAGVSVGARRRPELDWTLLIRELKRPGVKMTILWDEYRTVWAPPPLSQQKQTRWLYERARRRYNDAFRRPPTQAERKVFEVIQRRHQVFNKTDLAKFEPCPSGCHPLQLNMGCTHSPE
jgi:transposase